jgi:hypothetical protein
MVQLAAVSSAPANSTDSLEPVLANMELRALKVSFPDERARIFNLAGDLCFDAGSRERALTYYGRAIDVHIGANEIDSAVSVCRKIVRLTPEVVRARCTLAWVALGQGVILEAKQRIADYAHAASSAGQEKAASQQLRLMTEIAANEDVLQSLAEALLEIGDDVGADRAFGAAAHRFAAQNSATDPQARLNAVIRVLVGNDATVVQVAAAPMAETIGEPTVAASEPMVEPTRSAESDGVKRLNRNQRHRRYS